MNRADNFNRADSTTSLGSPSDGGTAWNPLSGTWGIDTNRGYQVSGSQSIAVLEASASDVAVQATLAAVGLDNGLSFRASDASNYLMAVTFASNVGLYKTIAGAFNEIGTGSATRADGDVLKVTAVGSTINVYYNGTLVIGPITETFNQTATQHGLRQNDTNTRFDDFSVTDLGAAAGGPFPFFLDQSHSGGFSELGL